jgi:oligopeptide transport system permease protein
MIRLLIGRIVTGVITVACIYTITFLMVVSIPGNPFQQGQHRLPTEVEAALRARYHMDNNWLYFLEFLEGAVRLDFGPTFMYADWTCNQIIAASLPVSMTLGLAAILLAIVVGVPIGVLGAVRRHGLVDVSATALILTGISLPTFVTGSVLLIVVAVHLHAAPVGGWGTLAHVPLPAITLALPFAAYIARLMRTSMLDTLGSDFVRTALAKGSSRSRVIWRHAVPVAILPILSFLGPATAQAMTGSFVVEKVFGVPGIGQHFVNAALNRDPGLLLGTVLVFSTLLVAFNIVVDLLYRAVDPRIQEGL